MWLGCRGLSVCCLNAEQTATCRMLLGSALYIVRLLRVTLRCEKRSRSNAMTCLTIQHVQVLRALLEQEHVDVNVGDNNGDSALHWVRSRWRCTAVSTPNLPWCARCCCTRSEQAAFKGHRDCVDVMLKLRASATSDDSPAADADDVAGDVHDAASDAGASIEYDARLLVQSPPSRLRTALEGAGSEHFVAPGGVTGSAKPGALDLDHHNADGGTPLHSAANNGDVRIGELLLMQYVVLYRVLRAAPRSQVVGVPAVRTSMRKWMTGTHPFTTRASVRDIGVGEHECMSHIDR